MLEPRDFDLDIACGKGIEEALNAAMALGPTSHALQDQGPETRAAVATSICRALQPYRRDKQVSATHSNLQDLARGIVVAGKDFEVRRLSGSIGAEILGIDLASETSDNVIGEIRQIWLEHNVIFFRDQDLPPAEFLAFAKRFGEVVEYPFINGIEGFPEIIPVVKLQHETKNFGGIWHTDTAYLEIPPMGTMLIAREVPPHGGDTLFANTYLAYETLSEGMKRMLDKLIAVNHSAKADVTRTREDRIRDGGKTEAKKEYVSEHPVVRTHPETGRKALYINFGHTLRFKDMTEAESTPLLNFLFEHQTKPEFTCRFNWRVGSLAFWDNRCALHNPVNDYHGFRRVMHRVTLAGDKPR